MSAINAGHTVFFSLSVSIAPHPHKNTSHYIIEGEVVNWLVDQKKNQWTFFAATSEHFCFLFYSIFHVTINHLWNQESRCIVCLVNILKKISDLLDCVWLNLWIWTDDNLSKTHCTKIWEKSNISNRNIYTKVISIVRIIYFRTFCPN